MGDMNDRHNIFLPGMMAEERARIRGKQIRWLAMILVAEAGYFVALFQYGVL